MDRLRIDKGIPIPKKTRYPFTEMKIGDSFFAPLAEGKRIERLQSSITGAARSLRDRLRITTRRVEEKGIAGVRVWRIE